ncbi:MAG: sulfotransferase domain-containing protein [bacterium]|nr:sulfotransferase domain-containing protein [bacterium]
MKVSFRKHIIQPLYKRLSGLPLLGAAAKKIKVNRNYAVERQVLKGAHRTTSQQQSIVFFTVYKAASSFIGSFLKKIALEAGITPVDLDGYFFQKGKGKEWEGSGRNMVTVPYSPTGYLYGPFRSFNPEIPNRDDYKIIVILRDPRDVIVSAYFSIYSHVTPLMEGTKKTEIRLNRRQKRLERTLDEYVVDKLDSGSQFLERYYRYKELVDKPNVLFLKYEDMINDFENWLERLLDFLSTAVSPLLLEEIRARANSKVSKEDKFKHKRQVTPGDHKRKLKPETIDILNKRTEEILKTFGYK